MADLDLMVQERSVGELRATMEELGYRQCLTSGPPEVQLLSMRQGYRPSFEKSGRLPVDVHTTILGRRAPAAVAALPGMWANAQTHAAMPIRGLAPSHFLLYGACHYMKHLELSHAPLSWLLDLLLAVHEWGDQIDWPDLWQTAQRWRMSRDAAVVLGTLNHHWGLPVPGLPAGVDPLPTRSLLHGVPGARTRSAATIPGGYLRRFLGLRELPGASSRLRYLRFLFFPPPADLRRRYNVPLGKAIAPFYLRHLATLAGRFLGGLVAWARLRERPRAPEPSPASPMPRGGKRRFPVRTRS